jgi:hypothetical protein
MWGGQLWLCEKQEKEHVKGMGNTVIGLLINLERIFGNVERNAADKERPDDCKDRVCMD